MIWYALRTLPLKEFAVEQTLRHRGLQVFLPVEIRHARKGRKRAGLFREYPLIPRYIFVAGADPWDIWRTFNTRGVSGVVSFDGYTPAAIRDEAIRKLAQISGGVVPTRQTRIHKTFRPGETVQISKGPLKEWLVRLEDVKGDKARVLVQMFGSMQTVEMPIANLEAA